VSQLANYNIGGDDQLWYRQGSGSPIVWSDWREIYHTGNLPELTSTQAEDDTDTTYGLVTGEILAGAVAANAGFTFSSEVATTSGSAFDFTSVPSWATELIVLLDQVSLSDGSRILIQLSTGGTFKTSEYSARQSADAVNDASTAGFLSGSHSSGHITSGRMNIIKFPGSTKWDASFSAGFHSGGGVVDLGGDIDGLRFTRLGSGSFDNGSVTVGWR